MSGKTQLTNGIQHHDINVTSDESEVESDTTAYSRPKSDSLSAGKRSLPREVKRWNVNKRERSDSLSLKARISGNASKRLSNKFCGKVGTPPLPQSPSVSGTPGTIIKQKEMYEIWDPLTLNGGPCRQDGRYCI